MHERQDYCRLFRMLAEYNRWMNERLYALCTSLTEEERRKDLGASFGSVHATLDHLLYGDRAWMGRFTGVPFTVTVIGQDLYSDFDELRREREKTDAEIIAWFAAVPPEWFVENLTYTSNVDRVERTLPYWGAAIHLFNHQTHHRGQLTTMLQQLGCASLITDIPWMDTAVWKPMRDEG